MLLPRTARKTVKVDVDSRDADGTPVALTGVRFAFCDHGGPVTATVWIDAAAYVGPTETAPGVATAILAGRDAELLTGALVLTDARAELWGLPVTGGTSRDPWYIDTVETP